jgi:glyoxylase-like metal-dependent hydrolase (beta-lactamase superfamily II)
MSDWAEIADRVYVLRYPVLDVNSTLVVGDGAALLVDTFGTARQAGELRDAVRRVTSAPPMLVNTHHHFDHAFGNGTLRSSEPVWGHARCAELLRGHADQLLHAAAAEYPDLAGELADTTVSPPDVEVHDGEELDVGGRRILLRYLGRAHTDNDLAVLVPDAGVTLTGDLVEAGAPPAFGDSWPLEWPATLAALLILAKNEASADTFVPGHGAPVDEAFVQAQHAQLTELEWLCRDGHADSAPIAEITARSPFGAAASLSAVRRAYATLDGQL